MNTTKPLSAANQIHHQALARSLAAVHHLNDRGANVKSIEIRGGKPVITIDGPQVFLKGAMHQRATINGAHRVTMAAPVLGCQVEWCETYPVARKASSR